MNDLLAELLCQRITAALERGLTYAPETRLALARLAGRTLGIECTVPPLPPLSALMSFTGEGVLVTPGGANRADAVVRGSLPALVALATPGEGLPSPGAVRISGDAQLIDDLRASLATIDLDWEAALAALLGDVPAHLLGKVARGASHWQDDAQRRGAAILANFVAEEARFAPRPVSLASLAAGVATLTTQLADRLRPPR